jgi:hypothetical protein
LIAASRLAAGSRLIRATRDLGIVVSIVFSDGARRPRLGLDAGNGSGGGLKLGLDLVAKIVG